MSYNVLNNNDCKNLEELERITKSISNLYDKLCALEINGKCKTEEYNKIYECLIIAIEVEKSHYKSMNLDYSKIVAFLEYIDMNLKNNILEGIINQNYNDKINYRILRQFFNILQINQSIYNQYIKEEISIRFEIDDYDEEIITNEAELDMALQSDINSLFIYYLQDLIDNDLYNIYKKQLIMTKYFYSFIESDLTSIDNNLLASISNFDVISEFQKLSNKFKYQFVRDTQFENLKQNIVKLFEIADYKCKKKNYLTKMLLRDCYIRAQLLVFELSDLVEISDKIEETISKHNYMKTHSICGSLLINSIREVISSKLLKLTNKSKINN